MPVPTVDRARLTELYAREERSFEQTHPRSLELFGRARRSLFAGVPMHWMTEWAGPFPVFVEEASGARFSDVDGNEYVDLCLGDTGAMTGHAPDAAAVAVAEQMRRGTTLMLPTEDSIWVGEEMTRRFGLPSWQFALTATDANRFTIRLARAATGRPKVLVHNWCYHGSVDETFAVIADGGIASRPNNIGAPVDPSLTTRVVEINDLDGLERELADGDVACCLFEPALTNIGIVLPEPGYHEAVRELTRRHGTFLVIDETHTLCSRARRLHPRARSRARLPDGRKAARERRPRGRVRHVRGRGAPRRRRAPARLRSTSAASAGRWPGTPSRCGRCGRRSSTSSRTRRSSG